MHEICDKTSWAIDNCDNYISIYILKIRSVYMQSIYIFLFKKKKLTGNKSVCHMQRLESERVKFMMSNSMLRSQNSQCCTTCMSHKNFSIFSKILAGLKPYLIIYCFFLFVNINYKK